MYTIITRQGRLLPAWVASTQHELKEEVEHRYDEKDWLEVGMAQRMNGNVVVRYAKVDLVPVGPDNFLTIRRGGP